MATQSRFAIDGSGWTMSFQRRVGSANRGAIPYAPLDSQPEETRVLIPLRDGEALWIAILADSQIIVEGLAGDRPLRVETLPAHQRENLKMLNAVLDQNRWLPIDTRSVACATDHRDATGHQLTVVVSQPATFVTQTIAIVLATPVLYSEISRLPAPDATTERDQYGGWRLP